MKFLERVVEVFLILGIIFILSGCHTVHGFGQDLEMMSQNYVTE